MSRDRRHGGPFDRGGADSYYRRPPVPHWYPGGTGRGPRIERDQMTAEQVAEYYAGYDENERDGNFKWE